MSQAPTLTSVVEQGIATVTINDPGRRNALTPATLRALIRDCERLDADPAVRVLAVRGHGADFSAGVAIDHLEEALLGAPDGGLLTAACRALARVRVPTLALLRGVCMGGAWQLAASADMSLAAQDVRVAITPAKLGLILPEPGVRLLARRVGLDRARYLLFTGDEVSSARAEAWGLVTQVVPASEFDAAAAGWCARLRDRSDFTQAAVGCLLAEEPISAGPDGNFARYWAALAGSEDLALGTDAFARKESPQFTWRRP